MPRFSNQPPADPRGPGFTIYRTPANQPLTGIVTCEDLLGCSTHWYGNRTTPCEAPDCDACRAQVPWRWHGYLTALNVKTHEHFLFEMTAQAADHFVAYRASHGTLRGCLFQATRFHRRTNGRVDIYCKPANLQEVSLPTAPDLRKVLSVLWNLPVPEVNVNRKTPGLSVITPDRKRSGDREAALIGDILAGKGGDHPR